jgi:anti-sigma B factor antagonist
MGPGELEIDIQAADGVTAVRVAGEIDLSTAEDVVVAVGTAARPGGRIELDLRPVAFMDSSGVAALTRCRRLVDAAGGALTVRCASTGPVAQLVEWTGLQQVLDIRLKAPAHA